MKRDLRVLIAASFCALSTPFVGAATVNYTMQTGNFNAQQTRIPSGGFAASYNQSGTEVGLYAHGGSGGTNETAFETFSTTGTTSGSARPLQIGDNFSITMYSGSNPFGFVGVYFGDNTTYSAYSDYNTNERTAVVLGSSGNWIIENNGTSVDTGIGNGISITATIMVTSSNTFNMAITNNTTSVTTTYYDLVMQNTPGTTNRIQSFALAVQNDNSADLFVKNGSLTNTGSVTLGASNLSLTVSGVITDGLDAGSTSTNSVNSVTKSGTGTTTLTGTNTYTGSTNVNSGTLELGNGSTTGSLGSGTVNLAGGATLAINRTDAPSFSNSFSLGSSGDAFVSVASGQSATLTGDISSGGAEFWKSGAGTLVVNHSTSSFNTSVVIQAGTLETDSLSNAGSNSSLGKGGIFIGQGGSGTLRYTGSTATTDRLGTSALQGSTLNGIDISNSGTNLTVSSNIGELTSGKALTKTGAGTLTLSGANTYTGGTNVNAGTVALGASNALADTGAVAVNGGTFDIGGNSDTVGAVTLTSGNISGSGGTLTGSSYGVQSGNISAILGGSGVALTKSTSGTVILSGANTYTGATTNSAGTLLVNGSITSAVTVSAGTLGGSGTTGAVSVASGANLAPGNSPGILNTGNLSLALGANYLVDIAGTTVGMQYDQTNVTGTVSLAGSNLILNLTYSPVAGNTFVIINNDGTSDAVTGTFAGLAEGATISGLTISYHGGDGNDVVLSAPTAVPEPSTWLAAALSLGAVGFTQRRRITRAFVKAA